MRGILFLGLALVVLMRPAVGTANQATPEEARELAARAADFLRVNGPEKAFPIFNTAVAPWRDRDLFVMVLDSKGVIRAHGDNADLIGLSVLDLRDVDGTPVTRDALAVSEAGWIRCKWRNPATGEVEPRVTYTVRVGDFAVEAGAYVR